MYVSPEIIAIIASAVGIVGTVVGTLLPVMRRFDRRFDGVRSDMNQRFEQVEQHFAQRFEQIDAQLVDIRIDQRSMHKDIVKLQVAVARLEGPEKHLLLVRG